MKDSRRRLLVTTAVFVGAMVLFGPLTYGILVTAVDALARLAGAQSGLSDLAANVVSIAAVLVAAEVVTEITAIQLYGFGALWRGSRRQRLVRHALLGLVVLAAAGLLVGYLVDVVRFAAVGEDTTTLAMAGLVALALLWAGGRTVQAFRRGFDGERPG